MARVRRRRGKDRTRVLIVVQNLPLPRDRRVWLECQALVAAGFHVSAITPKGEGDPDYEEFEGVHLYKYEPPPASAGHVSYVREFVYCWLATARLALRVYREQGFGVLQACNPPDTFWALALLFRPRGVRFVFDQHDLCPEVYEERFDRRGGAAHRALLALEKASYRTAHAVISTNESYRGKAIERGGCDPAKVTVVRTGPDSSRMVAGPAVPALRHDHEHLAVYVGVMGPQDGVDVLVEAIDHYVNVLGRTDTWFALLGAGDAWDEVRALVAAKGLDKHVYLPGWAFDDMLFGHLSTASVGLCPDPPGPLNDVSTMNKTMEYMAFGVPVVAFDLHETRVSAGEAAVYVADGSPKGFAEALASLLDDSAGRAERGRLGRERITEALDWRHQAPHYVKVFRGLAGR